MALPRLRADIRDSRIVARVLREALRHEVALVPLHDPPVTSGQHLLEIEVPGEGLVTLLADPVDGPADEEGVALHVRPVTRPQMAALLAMVERLDTEPSKTEPPSQGPPPGSAPPHDDATIVDAMSIAIGFRSGSEPPVIAEFNTLESLLPMPPSSGAQPPSSTAPTPRVSAAPSDPFVGRVIAGKYRIEGAIGSGSTAAVYRATHLDLRRSVAVKILHAQNRAEMQFVKRFKGEALAASKLEHPNVARVTDFGQEKEDGLLYLVMELLDGKSLEAILAVEKRLNPHHAVTIAIQTCSALASAHDVGIIHRDVKPENIMLVPSRDDDGNPCDLVKVCDFGMAKLREPDPENVDLTTAGMLCGSPAYMSPEQTRGEPLDARTDVYSLGVTLFESLTGELPHEGETITQLFVNKMTANPRRPTSLVVDIDPVLEDVVLRALATDPRGRHANARVFREELRAALAMLEAPSSGVDGTIIAD
ncbi:MAG TPA: serine/threonine-protein kinase [Labilithrix sp.]|jgi:serine/threonine-protein kinase